MSKAFSAVFQRMVQRATVCAILLQTFSRGDNLTLTDQLRTWAEELRRR